MAGVGRRGKLPSTVITLDDHTLIDDGDNYSFEFLTITSLVVENRLDPLVMQSRNFISFPERLILPSPSRSKLRLETAVPE